MRERSERSSVTLGSYLNFIFLPDGKVVTLRALGGVDDLVSEDLRDRLDASEGGFTGTLADEVEDSLIDSAETRIN